jgi:prepilin-type processing-associated H-X9-DG protein
MKQQNTFSLIELLVVFGLIMILMSLLQPSLKSLLMKGDAVHCLNNQRQVYQGYSLYGEENADRIVPGIQITYSPGSNDWRRASRLVTWDEAILNYFRQTPIPSNYTDQVAFHNYKLNYKTEGLDVFSCPRHTDTTTELHPWVGTRSFQRSYSTIGIGYKNTTAIDHDHYYMKNGPSGVNWSMTFNELPNPSNTFLLSEHFHGHNMVGYIALQNQRGPSGFANYHNSRYIESPHGDMTFNFLYTDGHTENHFIFEYGQTTTDRHGPWTMVDND